MTQQDPDTETDPDSGPDPDAGSGVEQSRDAARDPGGPLARLAEARWLLALLALLATAAVGVYGVPWPVAAGAAVLAATAAGAFGPRRSGRRLRLEARREQRRLWPDTGMKAIVDALPMPCFVADGRGVTRYVNAVARERYGAVRPGDPISFGLRAPALLEALDRVRASGRPERIEWAEKVPTESWFEASIAPIALPAPTSASAARPASARPAPDFLLVALRDLTEQRRLERMRTDFVANASHELRTPLASLTGFIETLQGPARDDEAARERFLAIMLDQANRMRRLIDDILSLSRIELKAHVRPDTVVDLAAIVRHTADALAPLAADLGMAVELDLPDAAVPVRGDRDELIQVAENLIENALKYGSTGRRVEVALRPEGDGASVFSVRDFGEGIAPEHLPRLTERFYRVDVASSRTMKGTGLGLAIVKHILTRHRARLEIDSRPGAGACFSVRFQSPGKLSRNGNMTEIDNNKQDVELSQK
ncbi:ATP-binding protein [Polymorphum gilvum]|uniref:histidine kinase n=1 Tax=Polymorphum gilvum (strain LMG 25793 / CGMCC 1.9160 / SL003B-26A1) TaxID=991905 RepID=F2IY91_POLGS|nr:ATP-binding protein [Polymorphum gilvum]ADZ71703.1 ATPase, histidine kinase-, DNA gyrase B-, and HSP90-like domain protein [Polymorphum gilvum SL003B-26A1]